MKLLFVDNDMDFVAMLCPQLTRRGFIVYTAHNSKAALAVATKKVRFALLETVLETPDAGITLIAELIKINPSMQIVVLTRQPGIATAVFSFKMGARDYLLKPADVDDIINAFDIEEGADPGSSTNILSHMEWQNIKKALDACNGNISETARSLSLHRRTLQRKIARYRKSESGSMNMDNLSA